MKTPINDLINWIEEIENSIFSLSASEIELKMLDNFKVKLRLKLEDEKLFAKDNFVAGCYFASDMEHDNGYDVMSPDFEDHFEIYK